MFSSRKKFTFGTGDHDTNDKVVFEVPTNGGAIPYFLPHSICQVHIDEPHSSTSSPNEPQVEDIYSIARDKPKRTIRTVSYTHLTLPTNREV